MTLLGAKLPFLALKWHFWAQKMALLGAKLAFLLLKWHF